MERSRLKTIIILILAMMNLALALSLGLRLYQGRAAETALLTELRERFTAEGCALPEDIPTEAPPMVVTMERDSGREQAMAEAILGGGTEYIDQGGGISVYRNGSGQATFRAGGSFSVTLRLPDGEATPMEQAEQRSRAFARAAGFETPTLLSGSGSAAQHRCGGGGLPKAGLQGAQNLQRKAELVVVVHFVRGLQRLLVAAVQVGQILNVGFQFVQFRVGQAHIFNVGDGRAQILDRALGGVLVVCVLP